MESCVRMENSKLVALKTQVSMETDYKNPDKPKGTELFPVSVPRPLLLAASASATSGRLCG